ncbi:hypothetical protein SLS53_007308 [Cytospora paraplurivora]|uniref:BZIP domain-containing protein n=1 Tax=Cytospora paraplurivora TaxID=2898453 RepID=A0AAN9U9F6_9PEZI
MATGKSSDDNKRDPIKQDSEESPLGSSPDGELGEQGDESHTNPTPENQAPKRKGGRKPIYATTEERKQRNRQAQAAFRERRTEYIKQLEQTISVQEQTLANLNAAHRTAADECLMLRYKNSLLERILLEKGIDVQAELQAKHGSPNFGPTHTPQNMIQPPPISRTLLNRHNSRRSNSSIAPKLEPGYSTLPPIHAGNPAAGSPKSRPTPSSHAPSPTTTEGFEQEYDAAADLMDEGNDAPETPSGPGPYPGASYAAAAAQQQQQQQQQAMSPTTTGPMEGHSAAGQPQQGQHGLSMTQLLDPSIDWDPFGLSASMAFPSSFSFDTSNMR